MDKEKYAAWTEIKDYMFPRQLWKERQKEEIGLITDYIRMHLKEYEI